MIFNQIWSGAKYIFHEASKSIPKYSVHITKSRTIAHKKYNVYQISKFILLFGVVFVTGKHPIRCVEFITSHIHSRYFILFLFDLAHSAPLSQYLFSRYSLYLRLPYVVDSIGGSLAADDGIDQHQIRFLCYIYSINPIHNLA